MYRRRRRSAGTWRTASGTCCSRRRARPSPWCAICTTPRRRRSTTRNSPPTWRTAASTSTIVRAARCAPISGASTSCTPRSCGASACSRSEFGDGARISSLIGPTRVPELAWHEAGNQLVDQLRRLDVRRRPDAGQGSILPARECRCERFAARLRRDDVLAAAGHQHLLLEAPRIHRETALRKAMHRLPVALRSDAALAPADEFQRERRRAFGDQRRRAFARHAFGTQLFVLLQAPAQLVVFVCKVA